MTPSTSAFLDALQAAATRADGAEAELRKEIAARIKTIEQERVFAYRRLNLMRTVSQGVANAETEEIAVANSLAIVRDRLGWGTDSEPRLATLEHFAPVGKAVFLSLAPPEAEAQDADVLGALKTFEAWYLEKFGSSFWVLFEHYIPETPVVDF
jgi:hypothetical protein